MQCDLTHTPRPYYESRASFSPFHSPRGAPGENDFGQVSVFVFVLLFVCVDILKTFSQACSSFSTNTHMACSGYQRPAFKKAREPC